MIAELLCNLDGNDPEEMVDLKKLSAVTNAYGQTVMAPERGGQWMLYEKEARRFVMVFDALSGKS